MATRVAAIGTWVIRVLKQVPVAVLLLVVAAAASLGAWTFQASAAADFSEATRIQQREIPSDADPPPSPEQNQQIIASLDQSIAVRRQIDEQLKRIEASVVFLSGRQREAGTVSARALEEVRKIAAALGGANTAAGIAVERLQDLSTRLHRSVRIAESIARELAELDRKIGPSVGRR